MDFPKCVTCSFAWNCLSLSLSLSLKEREREKTMCDVYQINHLLKDQICRYKKERKKEK